MADYINLSEFLSAFKLIFFDLDGVLINSCTLKVQCMREALYDFDPKTVEKFIEAFKHSFGNNREYHFRNFYENYLHRKTGFMEYFTKYSSLYEKELSGNYKAAPLSPYAKSLLIFLRSHHISCYLVTGTKTGEALDVLENHKIKHNFKGVFGSPHNKTDAVQTILEKEKVMPKETILIGDAKHDYDVANINKVNFLFVSEYSLISLNDLIPTNYFYFSKNLSCEVEVKKVINNVNAE